MIIFVLSLNFGGTSLSTGQFYLGLYFHSTFKQQKLIDAHSMPSLCECQEVRDAPILFLPMRAWHPPEESDILTAALCNVLSANRATCKASDRGLSKALRLHGPPR